MSARAENPRSRTLLFSLVALLQSLIWGIGSPVTKLALGYLSPSFCLAVRFTVAVLLYLVFFGRRIAKHIRGIKLVPGLVTGLAIAASFITANFALDLTQASIAGFLFALSVVFTPFVSWAVLGAKVSARVVPIIVLVTVGLYLLCGGGAFVFGLGELLAIASALTFSFCLAYSSKYLADTDPIALSFSQAVVTMVVCWIMALLFERQFVLKPLDLGGWLAVAYLSLGSSFLAYLLQNLALANISSTLTSLILCCESVFSAVASFIFLGERLGALGLVGAALILTGVVLATLFSSKDGSANLPEPEQPAHV